MTYQYLDVIFYDLDFCFNIIHTLNKVFGNMTFDGPHGITV